SLRLGRLGKRNRRPQTFPAHLSQEHSADADAISRHVADFLSLRNPPGASVDRLVGIVIGRGTAAPFKKTHKIASNLEVPVGRTVAVGAQRFEEGVEGLLSNGPFLMCNFSCIHCSDSPVFATHSRFSFAPGAPRI